MITDRRAKFILTTVRISHFKVLRFTVLVCTFFVSAAAALLLQNPANAAVISSTQPASLMDGLVGWWTFDGADLKNNVADKSGNGNNGRLVGFGATSTIVVPGKIGQSLMFDGIDDYVSLPDIDNGITNKVSISAWIYPYPANAGATYQSVVGSHTNNGFMSFIRYNTFFWDTKTDIGRVFTSAGTISNNKWQHIIGTYDGSYMRWYIDGVEVYSSAQTGNIIQNNIDAYIGYCGYSTQFFHGMIDDVRIYNRTLSGAEAKQLYNLGSEKVNSTLTTAGGDTLKSSLVAWWTFDGADLKNNVADKSGVGNNANLVGFGATSTAVVAGKIGQALKFNGANAAKTASNLTIGSSIATISFWGNLTNPKDSILFELSPNYNSNANSFLIDPSPAGGTCNNKFAVSINSGGYLLTCFTRPSDGWHHYLFILNNSTALGSVTAYVDNVPISLTTSLNGKVGSGNFLVAPFYIMGRGATSAFASGSLDDVRIYSRALSTSEIEQLYNLSSNKINSVSTSNAGGDALKSGLIGWWTFDGPNLKTNVADSSGNGSHGYLTGFGATSTAVVAGKIGQALKFNGTSNYISAPISSLPTDFTITTWFKLNELGREQHVAEFSSTQLYVASNNKLGTPAWGTAYGNTTLKKGVWYFGTVVRSGTAITLYLNGNQDGSGTAAANPSSPFVIGDLFNHAGNYKFNGSIDDVRAYNRVLSAAEIKQIYNLGR